MSAPRPQRQAAGASSRNSRARIAAAVAIVAAGLACSLRAPRTTEGFCNGDSQCPRGQVCFANECRAPASALQSVVIEVTPATSSAYSPIQQAFDLKTSAVTTVDLPLPSRLQGSVLQNADDGGSSGASDAGVPVGNAQLVFTDAAPLLPGRVFTVTSQTDASGVFSARLGPAAWKVRITPPAPLPPFSTQIANPDSQGVIFRLPAPGGLSRVTGSLKSAGVALAGARVTPVSRDGVSLGASATADASGRFQFLLPPPPVEYAVRIGDAPDGGVSFAGGPIPSFADDVLTMRTATSTASTIDLDVGALPAAATLSGTVADLYGAPIANARITALSESQTGWILNRSTSSAADGTFALGLREGRYLIEAAPALDASAAALSGEREVQVGAPTTLVAITCAQKVRALGKVLRSSGHALGAGATVNATRLPDRVVGGRIGTTTATDANGLYTLTGDPGTYRVEIVPSPESGEPRQLAYLQLGQSLPGGFAADLEPIVLSPALVVAGLVRGPSGGQMVPVAGATVEAYAVNAAGDGSVHLGGTVTDAAGKYRLVLPDVSQPASLPAAK